MPGETVAHFKRRFWRPPRHDVPRRIHIIGVPFNSSGRTDGVARAPAALRAAALTEAIERTGNVVEDRGDVRLGQTTPERDPVSRIIAPTALASMIRAVESRVAESLALGGFPLVVGGDCPILLGCLAALKARDASSGLVFVDGHEDAWPPDRSPTGEAADMELGLLLGVSDVDLPLELGAAIPRMRFDDVAVLGPRDQAEIRAAGVDSLEGRVFYRTDGAVATDPPGSAGEAVERIGESKRWWLHVDLDVLASECLAAVDYPQPGGLDWDVLGQITAVALAAPGIAGWTVTVYNPDLDPDGSGAARIVAFIAEALRP